MDSLLAASTAYGTGRTTGTVAVGLLLLALARQFLWLRNDKSTGVKRALVVGGIAVMVVVNIGRVTGDGDSWESTEAKAMKADFIGTCSRTSGTVVDCNCVFQQMTARGPYDTPDGFAELMESADPPPAFVAAFQSCPLPGQQPVVSAG